MEEKVFILTGLCPCCNATLDYAEDASAVHCFACGTTVPTAKIQLARPNNQAENEADIEQKIVSSTLSAEASLVYVTNYLEEYDWASFAEGVRLTIPLLDAIAENCKMKFSTDPLTYILNFRRIAAPVIKKIEGLELLSLEIVNKYKSDDMSDTYEYFDTYSAITHAIADAHDSLYKELAATIRMADKFGADKEIIRDLENSLELFESKVNSVKVVDDITEIESYSRAKEKKDEAIVMSLRDKKIDAQKTYDAAMELLMSGQIDNALHLFGAIRGYRDSKEIIFKHTGSFKFNEELYELAGHRYIYIKQDITEFNVKRPDVYTKSTLGSLYEIKDGVISAEPTLSQISELVGCYGSYIYFIRNNEAICYFDTNSTDIISNVRILDSAMRGDYVTDKYHPVRFSSDRSKFFIQKKLRDNVRRGCFGRKKKSKSTFNKQNNYSVVLVDMDNVSVNVILPEIVDVMDYFGDKIFYTTMAQALHEDETNEAIQQSNFRVCNIETGENESILDAECVIHAVLDESIIYSVWAPNKYNMDLYALDLKSKEKTLIDNNILAYYTTKESRVYYIIGSQDYNRLYCANLDGTGRFEVMENAGRIIHSSSSWIYYQSGQGRNRCLMKVSTDGKKNMLVASRLAYVVKFATGYIYYVNTQDELHVVRSDGYGDRKITDCIAVADEINDCIHIDDKNVYCLRYEYVGENDGDEHGMSNSLYRTDLDGKNLRKLVFGAVRMKAYDDNTLYICKQRVASYTVNIPTNKGSREEFKSEIITDYISLDKPTGKLETIVTLGAPTPENIWVKPGCLRRKKLKSTVIIETTVQEKYVRKGLSSEGDISREMEYASGAKRRKKQAERERRKEEKAELKAAKRRLKSGETVPAEENNEE